MKKPLAFEVSAPATDEFMPLIEVTVAGVLSDFGLGESSGNDFARELIRGLASALPKATNINKSTLHCTISIDGIESCIKLWCDPPCDLNGLAGTINRSKKMKRWTASAMTEQPRETLTLSFKLPKTDQ